MHHCLIKPQTVLIPGASVEFSYTSTMTHVAIEIDHRVTIIKFSAAGDLISVKADATEVDKVDRPWLIG